MTHGHSPMLSYGHESLLGDQLGAVDCHVTPYSGHKGRNLWTKRIIDYVHISRFPLSLCLTHLHGDVHQ